MITDSDLLQTLDKQIAEHSEKLNRLLTEKEKLELHISQTQQWLERAKLLRQVEVQEAGVVEGVQPAMPTSHRFFGMLPREACHAVLRERRRMSKDDLADELKKGGYQFGMSSPLRVVHFALVNDRQVKMDDYGYVEWIEEVS